MQLPAIDRVARVGLIAGALAIPVNDHLLSLSDKALSKAIQAMISWGHGPMGHIMITRSRASFWDLAIN